MHNSLLLGSKFSLRFICEVSVAGHNYVGVGNSTNKKDAQGNASKDFLMYLTRQGVLSSDSIPSVSLFIFIFIKLLLLFIWVLLELYKWRCCK